MYATLAGVSKSAPKALAFPARALDRLCGERRESGELANFGLPPSEDQRIDLEGRPAWACSWPSDPKTDRDVVRESGLNETAAL